MTVGGGQCLASYTGAAVSWVLWLLESPNRGRRGERKAERREKLGYDVVIRRLQSTLQGVQNWMVLQCWEKGDSPRPNMGSQ